MAIQSRPMHTETKLYDYVMAQLKAKRVTQRQVADGSGVPFSTVAKISQQQIKDPSIHAIQKLADFFRAREQAAGYDRKAA